jgi:chromosome segregation ATPase
MWNKFKSIASEAFETARELEHHIREVTSGDYELQKTGESGENTQNHTVNLRALHAEQQFEKAIFQIRKLNDEGEKLRMVYTKEIQDYQDQVYTLEQALNKEQEILYDKEKEISWVVQNYEHQLQEALREKNKLMNELSDIQKQMSAYATQQNNSASILNENTMLKEHVAELVRFKQDAQDEITDLRYKLDSIKKASNDKIDRGFFIQIISNLDKNASNPAVRKQVLESLVSVLNLSREEQSMLGIVKKSSWIHTSEEPSLVDSLQDFISNS